MNIIFFGSDDFASVHLEALFGSTHKVILCVTPPDKPQGRGMKITDNPVKEAALKNKCAVVQPEDINEPSFVERLSKAGADLFVVIAYGKILPQKILSIPKIYAINVHSSLLPQYRGAAPINWAIINGEINSGISIIKMSPKMDAGDIVGQKEIAIEDSDTSLTLREKMKKIGPVFLAETINAIVAHGCAPIQQDATKVTFAPKLTKELGRIDWHKSAHEINNLIRGLQPWPGVYTSYKNKILKILEAQDIPPAGNAAPGTICDVKKEEFSVTAAKGCLKIMKVHLEASKPMSVKEFLVGHPLKVGDRLGT